MELEMESEETFAFAVETSAEIEVLRQAVAYLMTRALLPMSAAGRDAALSTFVEEVGDMPPNIDPVTPAATRLFEAIAAAMPDHAARFAGSVRAVLAQYPPGTTSTH
ncbi:hypothetical protein [Methylobacterium sp. WL120]|uniref:hypothetical protein n=1 Tax=Methylobacterium sp. WL120 TaxID=2603887 RepID=UPI0011C7E4FE|nr:hypothetical protein [Methylobacterium sp. WL120]TXM65757.1 hypothetical protein FV229_14790 [Methylobacterium sp. WL120]